MFFALIFPLMFLVLFGGIFADPQQSKVEMVQVGSVPLFDEMPTEGKKGFEKAFEVTREKDLDAALAEVRKGDADVAVEMKGDEASALVPIAILLGFAAVFTLLAARFFRWETA